MKNLFPYLGTTFLLLLGVAILSIIIAWPVQLLWNFGLAHAIDGFNEITLWQALSINLLIGILFNSYVRPKGDN